MLNKWAKNDVKKRYHSRHFLLFSLTIPKNLFRMNLHQPREVCFQNQQKSQAISFPVKDFRDEVTQKVFRQFLPLVSDRQLNRLSDFLLIFFQR